jgi:hypothetical protein
VSKPAFNPVFTNEGVPSVKNCRAFLAAQGEHPGNFVGPDGVVYYRLNLKNRDDPRNFQPDPAFGGQNGFDLLKQVSDEKKAQSTAAKLKKAAEMAKQHTAREEAEAKAHTDRRPISSAEQPFLRASASGTEIVANDAATGDFSSMTAQRQARLEGLLDRIFGAADTEQVRAVRSASASESTFVSVVKAGPGYEILASVVYDSLPVAKARGQAMDFLADQLHTIEGASDLVRLVKGNPNPYDASVVDLPSGLKEPVLFSPKDGQLPVTDALKGRFANTPGGLDAFLVERARRAADTLNAAKELLSSRGLLNATYPSGLSIKIDDASFMFDINGNAYLVHPHVVAVPK